MNATETSNKFWQFVAEKTGPNVDELWGQDLETALGMLEAVIPETRSWLARPGAGRETPVLYDLLWCLVYCTDVSLKIFAFPLDQVRLHLDFHELREVLFNKRPKGTVPFFFNLCAAMPRFLASSNANEPLVNLVRRGTWEAYEYQKASREPEHQRYLEAYIEEGAALCFIRGTCLDVYALPSDPSICFPLLEEVRHDLRSMTAREKALRSLPAELKGLVDLLGWETVNVALQQLK